MRREHHRQRELCRYGNTALLQCPDCRLVISDKYLDGFDPKALYGDYYKNEISGRFKFGIEAVIKLLRLWRAFKIHTIDAKARRILDIGSGRGFMLYYLKKYYGFKKTAGTQIAQNMYEFSRDQLGLEVYNEDLLELAFENGTFDIITIWHVLEHDRDPQL